MLACTKKQEANIVVVIATIKQLLLFLLLLLILLELQNKKKKYSAKYLQKDKDEGMFILSQSFLEFFMSHYWLRYTVHVTGNGPHCSFISNRPPFT